MTETETDTPTRQERKKQRTRGLIRETAWGLFAAHGYAATTRKAIADLADVAPRTVTVHSPANDDLLSADDDYFGADRLEQRLAARPPGQPALETLRQWMIETIDDIGSSRAGRAGLYWRGRAPPATVDDR